MIRRYASIAIFVLMTNSCEPAMEGLQVAPTDVLLWQIDKLFVVRPGTSVSREVGRGRLKNMVSVNGSDDVISVVAFESSGPKMAIYLLEPRSGAIVGRIE